MADILFRAIQVGTSFQLASHAKTTGLNGRRLGTRHGNALEFAEYRDYQPGDDIRRLDWNVLARTEHFMVKLFSEEIDPRCDVLLDRSASIGLFQETRDTASAIAAIIVTAAQNAGFSLQLWHAGNNWEKDPNPSSPLQWQRHDYDDALNPGDSILQHLGGFFPRGIRIAISDFLWATPPETFLAKIANGAAEAVLIRLLHPEVLAPMPSATAAPFTLQDIETGETRELLVNPNTIDNYRQRLQNHLQLWNNAAQKANIQLIDINPAEFLQTWDCTPLIQPGILSPR